MKKFLAFLLSALVLCSSTAIPAGAVDIKISGTAIGYDAYRILDLSQGVKPGHAETGECPVEGCDKVVDPGGHWNYAYSVNDKYRSAIMAGLAAVDVESELDDRGMISEIEKLDNELTRMFADAVYGAARGLEAEYSVAGSELAGVEPGYYLIAEKAETGLGDSVSLVMLDTAGLEEVRVTTKEDVPTLEKSIMESGTSTVAGVGDTVRYSLVAELPDLDVLQAYDKYKFIFHDDVSDGLAVIPESVKCFLIVPGRPYFYTVTNQYKWEYEGEYGPFVEMDSTYFPDMITPDSVLVRNDGGVMSDDTCDLEVEISGAA